MDEDAFLATLASESAAGRSKGFAIGAARAACAPVFAALALLASLAAGWPALSVLSPLLALPWFLLAAAGHWLHLRRLRDRGGDAPPLAESAEGLGLGLLTISFPAYALTLGASPAPIAIAAAALIASAILLPARSAIAWTGTLLAAMGAGMALSGAVDPIVAAGLVLTAGAALAGHWLFRNSVARQAAEAERLEAESRSVGLLLREYEHRGAGWLWQVDAGNRILYLSRRVMDLLGRSPAQTVGQSFPAVLGAGGALGQTLLARQPFSNLEMEVRTTHGPRWIALAGDPVVDEAGEFQGFRGVGSDVTEARQTNERLTNLAQMDVLTGLPNRSRVRDLLAEALMGAQGSSVPCAILFLDLDGFKPVNDTFGHIKGDQVLKMVAERLVREVGGDGAVGRIGGDEFAVVVPQARNPARIETLGARLIAAISEPYQIDTAKMRIGLSIGCAFGPIDGQTVDDLIQKADMALYQAKARGRGICCAFDSSMQKEAENRLRLEEDLRYALAGNQFRLVYQPLVRSTDQRLVGFEALIRWHHPTRGLISPLDFIPLAEETGLITHLGDWVIEEACRAASHWPDHISVAVNLSPRQLVLPALPNAVSESLTRHKIKPNRLELEVTESVFLGETEGALDVLRRLRQLGVGIALDDFGTGYSSLGYLNKTVFHKLKIDGSFVREAAKNKETVAIIQSIVTLANSFRMTITAEGVETMADFERMRDMGCHQIQGFLFGRPLDFDKATALVHGGGAEKMSA